MSTVRLYVGNLPYGMGPRELIEIFREAGWQAERPHIVLDRESGQSKGFGFINIDSVHADLAMAALNGSEVGGRTIRVARAIDRDT
jgi:RNA recognition motif-containing protein